MGALAVVAFIAAAAFFIYRGRQRQASGTPYLSVGGTPGGGGGGGGGARSSSAGDIEVGALTRDWDTGWEGDEGDDAWGTSPMPGREALASPPPRPGGGGGGTPRPPSSAKASGGGWSDDDDW